MSAAWILATPGAVRPDPATGRNSWPLTETARRDVVLLAHALPRPISARIAAGSTRALQQTAVLLQMRLGGFVAVDPRLDSPARPPVWLEAYEELRSHWLRGAPVVGWEARWSVVARVLEAGRAAAHRHRGGTPVLVTGHLAAVAVIAALTGAEPGDDLAPRPAAFLVDPSGGRVTRVFPTVPRFEAPVQRDASG